MLSKKQLLSVVKMQFSLNLRSRFRNNCAGVSIPRMQPLFYFLIIVFANNADDRNITKSQFWRRKKLPEYALAPQASHLNHRSRPSTSNEGLNNPKNCNNCDSFSRLQLFCFSFLLTEEVLSAPQRAFPRKLNGEKSVLLSQTCKIIFNSITLNYNSNVNYGKN